MAQKRTRQRQLALWILVNLIIFIACYLNYRLQLKHRYLYRILNVSTATVIRLDSLGSETTSAKVHTEVVDFLWYRWGDKRVRAKKEMDWKVTKGKWRLKGVSSVQNTRVSVGGDRPVGELLFSLCAQLFKLDHRRLTTSHSKAADKESAWIA